MTPTQQWGRTLSYFIAGEGIRDLGASSLVRKPHFKINEVTIMNIEDKMEEKKTLEELAQPLKKWLVEHNDEIPSSKIVIDKYSVTIMQEIMGSSLNK